MTYTHMSWTGLPISRLAMGCEPLGGTDWGAVDIDLAHRAVECALDRGITVFDTADVYGLGRGEEELSRALGRHRHDVFVVTKFGVRWHKDSAAARARTFRDSSPQYLVQALEGSLRRLRLEAIPLYLVHWPDPKTTLEQTLDGLERARQAGKILNFRLSNFDLPAIEYAKANFAVSALEGPYNLLGREAWDGVYDRAKQLQITRIGYGPLAQGLLTGKYGEETRFGADDRRSRLPQFSSVQWKRNRQILAVLERIARERKVSMSQVALRWVLDSGRVDIAIAGAKSPDQVVANASINGWTLNAEEMRALGEVSANPVELV